MRILPVAHTKVMPCSNKLETVGYRQFSFLKNGDRRLPMRKKIYNPSVSTLCDALFSWPLASAIGLMLICLEYNQAWADNRDVPGLPIARLALPLISSPTEIGPSTGTAVGEKVVELKNMMQNAGRRASSSIQSIRNQYEKAIIEVNQYHCIVGEIEAKLQLGTTPSNPQLIELRNRALQQLDEISGTISTMDSLASEFSKNSEQVQVLASHVESSLRMPGAVDEDHAHLILMSDELSTMNAAISQSLDILNANTQRQSEWLTLERIHLANLSSAIDRGKIFISPQEEASKYPIPLALPEISLSPQKETHSHPSPKRHTQSPLQSKDFPKELSSEFRPQTPIPQIHQEVLQEIAQSSEEKTTPLPLLPISETHQDDMAITYEMASPEPLTPIPTPPKMQIVNEEIDQPLQEEAMPSEPGAILPQIASEEIDQPLQEEAMPSEPEAILPQIASEEVAQPLQEEAMPSEPEAILPQIVNEEVDQYSQEPEAIVQAPILPQEQPLPLVAVAPHPKVQPLPEEKTTPPLHAGSDPSAQPISYSTAAKGRSHLVLLDPDQEIRNQKWVLISSARRGLRSPSDILEIVNIMGENGPSSRGEEVKNLLMEEGHIKDEQLRVINVQGEENQKGQLYIFSEK